MRARAWIPVLAVAAICGAAIWGVAFYRSRILTNPQDALRRMPARTAVLLYIDFAALRSGGLLQMLLSSRVAEEPEYTAFVRKTEFDYKQDLDSALIAFAPKAKYFLARGRFDWPKLQAYAKEQAGRCYNTVCQLNGSTPDRNISFMPVRPDLMALAVSPELQAVTDLQTRSKKSELEFPDAPIWLSVPGSVLQSAQTLPEGTRAFARSMASADRITLSIKPRTSRFELSADVSCKSDADAAALQAQLEKSTTTLRDMIVREHKTPNARDLSGVLTAGSFRRQGTHVLGSWPVERSFLEELTSGGNS